MHIRYPKIHRYGAEENEGILIGTCFVQEKVDGANASIWLEFAGGLELIGHICCGSRGRELGNESFNGFVGYAAQHEGIRTGLAAFPKYRLFGEWLVRHTIAYNETAYKQFYLFDILDGATGKYLSTDQVNAFATLYGIYSPQLFGVFTNPIIDDIKKFVGQTNLGETGEGIVIKNPDYVNKFGDKVYAKLVTESFKEDNAIVFGGNNKHMDGYEEMYITNKYMTLPRVQKVMNKLQPEIDKKLGMEHTARIINTAYHDMITEEIWEIQKKSKQVDFKRLAQFSQRKAAKIYHDILSGDVSVAFKPHD